MRWYQIIYHRIKQLFVKPTCPYCALCGEPIYGERCEICDEVD